MATIRHLRFVVALFAVWAVLPACGDDDPASGGDASTDGSTDAPDSQMGDGSVDPDGCVPATCESLGETCGTFADGCGGSLICSESCSCTETGFETECPQRPCQTLSGCTNNVCQYTPVICGNQSCGPVTCDGDDCDAICQDANCDTKLHPCGGQVCQGVTEYCDPAPTVSGGRVVYQNLCVGPPPAGCGTCNLGNRTCDETMDRFVCGDVPVPVAEGGGVVECDSTVTGSTFLYVDTDYGGATSDGSRERPFKTFAAAQAAATTRNARGIVIAGSPVFTEPLEVQSGVSIYGGYGASPDFVPAPNQRPRWQIGTGDYDGVTNQLVGAKAIDIAVGTVLRGIEIRTSNATSVNDGVNGATNIALLARNAGALTLDDVILSAGAGGRAVDGVDGVNPANIDGGSATGRDPGPAPLACPDPCTVTTPVPNQSGNACGFGGNGIPNASWYANQSPTAGNPGNPSGTVSGGPGGAHAITNGCNLNTEGTVGGTGNAGAAGTDGDDGVPGTRGALDTQGRFVPGPGTSGLPGQRGTWGGGGGAGGGRLDTCMNDPRWGGHGTGGGAPGCGGDFGRRGGGGGASIGLAAVLSDGLSVINTTISSAAGGRGGDAGVGRNGGEGGEGGTTAMADTICTEMGPQLGYSSCYLRGGAGGRGGNGGRGGHGGAGAGGDSVAVYCVGADVMRAGATLTPGAAGAGGVSTAELNGEAGEAASTRGCS